MPHANSVLISVYPIKSVDDVPLEEALLRDVGDMADMWLSLGGPDLGCRFTDIEFCVETFKTLSKSFPLYVFRIHISRFDHTGYEIHLCHNGEIVLEEMICPSDCYFKLDKKGSVKLCGIFEPSRLIISNDISPFLMRVTWDGKYRKGKVVDVHTREYLEHAQEHMYSDETLFIEVEDSDETLEDVVNSYFRKKESEKPRKRPFPECPVYKVTSPTLQEEDHTIKSFNIFGYVSDFLIESDKYLSKIMPHVPVREVVDGLNGLIKYACVKLSVSGFKNAVISDLARLVRVGVKVDAETLIDSVHSLHRIGRLRVEVGDLWIELVHVSGEKQELKSINRVASFPKDSPLSSEIMIRELGETAWYCGNGVWTLRDGSALTERRDSRKPCAFVYSFYEKYDREALDAGDHITPEELTARGARLGDILIHPFGDRGGDTLFVNKDGIPIHSTDSNGHALAPLEITRHIKDPVTFYSDLSMDHTIRKPFFVGVCLVELDGSAHQELLKKLTGRDKIRLTAEYSLPDGEVTLDDREDEE